jgi:hypothetical protein
MAQDKTYEDGRQEQFQEVMERFTELSSKYGGVRGELLAKVKEELLKLRPARPVAKVVTANFLPSCRACGRTMKEGPQGSLVCQNGHTRLLAG